MTYKIPLESECVFRQETRDYGHITMWSCLWAPGPAVEDMRRAMIEWCHDPLPPSPAMNKVLQHQAYLRLLHFIHAEQRQIEQDNE